MREIKFRARALGMGFMVDGSLVERYSENGSKYYQIIDRYGDEYPVSTKSISQLCGYDANGNEVYEGDEVVAHDKIYTVELKPKYGLFNDLKHCRKK